MLGVVDLATFLGELHRLRLVVFHRQSGQNAVTTLADCTRGRRTNTVGTSTNGSTRSRSCRNYLGRVTFHTQSVDCNQVTWIGYTILIVKHHGVPSLVLVHGQVTIIFIVSVCLFVCLFVRAELFSAVFDPISIKLGHILYVWV